MQNTGFESNTISSTSATTTTNTVPLSPPLSPFLSPPLSPLLSPPLSPISASSAGIVEVVLHEGKNLVSKSKSADVYVRMKVGDGFFQWSKTSTAKTNRPKWNFTQALKVRPKQSKILHLRVNEVNFFSPDDTLGECHLDLEAIMPNSTHEMCMTLYPPHSYSASHSHPPGPCKGEILFSVSYYPNGKTPFPASRDSKMSLPMQILDQFKSSTSSGSINSPTLTPSASTTTTTTTTTSSTPTSPALNIIGPYVTDTSVSSPSQSKSPEQIQAEQLYTKAMEEMSRFVEYARTAKRNKLNNNKTTEAIEIENTLAPAALRMASQLLFEALKLHRSGKSFAMLAFIFFQFDSLELTSKYLGYAEQLEPTFPVIARLRKLLVESGCEREPLDAKVPNDRLSVVVVSAKGLPLMTPAVFCRLVVGYPEVPKDTAFASFSDLHPSQPPESGCVNWDTFFEVSLTKATERYHYGHQNLIVQLFEKTDDTVTMLGESDAIDLFSVERDAVHDQWVPITNGKGLVRIVFNYQMGYLTDREILPLLYSALLSNDQAMVTSVMKRNPNLDLTFRDTNSHNTPSELEPKNSTLLTKAARYGSVRLMKELIELGAKIDATDADGFTPIMRAVQFDGVHDNMRAIRFLYNLGADLSIRNHRSFDIFAYCQSVEMRLFLKERTQMQMFRFAVVICPNCTYVQFPICNELGTKTLQGKNCSCEIAACPSCSFKLHEEHRQEWLSSKREIHYAGQAFTTNLPDIIDHYLFQCPKCTSFGFPGTFTPNGSQLTTATDTAVVGTTDNTLEKTEFPLKDAESMWTLLHHGTGCSMYLSTYRLVRVKLSRTEVASLISLSDSTVSFLDSSHASPTSAPSFSSLTLEQLPTEILQHIIGYLASTDIATCENTSRKLRETCGDSFWKHLVKRDFAIAFRHGDDPQSTKSEKEIDSWKQTYLFYTKMYRWVKELLFEENFFPRCSNLITDNGQVEVRLRLNGKKYLFNLDGTPFTFEEEFILVLYFSAPGEITGLNIIAQGQSATNALQLCSVLTLPPSTGTSPPVLMSDLQRHQTNNGKVTLTLAMEQSAIKRWVAPYLAVGVPGFYAFLMLKDNVAGSVILDIFYYTLRTIVLENRIEK